MTNTTAELRTKLATMPNEVAQVKAMFRAVAANERVELELFNAVIAATSAGYIRWSNRAERLMFTDAGKKFYRSMRRFS